MSRVRGAHRACEGCGMLDHAADPPVGWIREIVLNSPDPLALSAFWARLVGGSPVEWYDGWITLEPPPHGQRLSFQLSDSGTDHSLVEVHFDVLVEDLEHAHGAVVGAGGTYLEERWSPRADPAGQPVPWRVYSDPDGHRFCLVVR
jgi:Glyoxalase-like domain